MALLAQSSVALSRSESYGGSGNYYHFMENNNNNVNYYNMNNTMMEKRQVFLRSYQFNRKKSLTEKIKRSLIRVKRVIWLRLGSARKFGKSLCFRLRYGLSYRKRKFLRLLRRYRLQHNCNNSYCFWYNFF